MSESGFFFDDNECFYCAKTHTAINSALKDIYFKYSRERRIDIEDVDIHIDTIKCRVRELKQITFQVTQKCNMKCHYCSVKGKEYVYGIPGESNTLAIPTARTVIDYIWELVKERQQKKMTFGFYGGEPLLEYENLKDIVEYAKKVFIGWDLSFSLTTNGTLLTSDKMIQFLVTNRIHTNISLDGPQKNHDAKRIFHDNQGSFERVIENLHRIREMDNDYYKNNITFSVVYSKDLSFVDAVEFFQQEELVRNNSINFAFVNESNTTYYHHYPYKPQTFRMERENVFAGITKKRKSGVPLSQVESSLFISHQLLEKSLGKRHFSDLMGACFLNSRLFVDANGGFHVCEKMNDCFPIGSARTGYDFEVMQAMISGYIQFTKTQCRECEVNFLCDRCYIHFAGSGQFVKNPDFCTGRKHFVKRMLEEITQ